MQVVEHTVAPGSTNNAAHEGLLLTALAHPNVVAVFRVCTLRVQPASPRSRDSAGSLTSSSAPPPASLPPVAAPPPPAVPPSVTSEPPGGPRALASPAMTSAGRVGPSEPGDYETWLVMEVRTHLASACACFPGTSCASLTSCASRIQYCNQGNLDQALRRGRLRSTDGSRKLVRRMWGCRQPARARSQHSRCAPPHCWHRA